MCMQGSVPTYLLLHAERINAMFVIIDLNSAMQSYRAGMQGTCKHIYFRTQEELHNIVINWHLKCMGGGGGQGRGRSRLGPPTGTAVPILFFFSSGKRQNL